MTALPHLFSPARIGALRLRNRLVMAPMENLYGTADGLPSARTIAYFAARARGGVGLITVGASSVDARHKEVPNSLHFADDRVLAAHQELTAAVHEHGALIQPQIVHAGPDGLGPILHGEDGLGPSAIQSVLTGATSRSLSAGEFAAIVDQYRAAAVRVRAAGYDGIELHAAHGYMLLGSFLTPWRNARRDRYSARSGDGGVRAVAEVVRAIKGEVGDDYPITLRISGFERVAGGRPSFDTQRIAPDLVAAGVDAFHVSGGVIDRLVTQMVNGAEYPDGLNVAAAAAVKRVVDVPVMVVGRIHSPEHAERILAAGAADFIVMGRPLIADPDLANKARAGGVGAPIRHCISCENCIDAMELRVAMDCAVNPRAGRELELTTPAATRVKRVVVIGGGPGGMEAARVAAGRGHRVTLYERQPYLGGALALAATVHPENQPFLDFLTAEVRRLGVSIELGAEVDADFVAGLGADAVIVASGGRVVAPSIAGDDLPHVLSGGELRGLLTGSVEPTTVAKLPWWQRAGLPLFRSAGGRWMQPPTLRRLSRVWLPLGRRVAIVGADLAAIELAEFLAERRRSVSILETAAGIAPEIGDKRRAEHMEKLDRLGVPINTGVVIDRITPLGVVLRLTSGTERLVTADNVVIAGQVEPDTTLYDSIRDHVDETYAVGDCTGLGVIRKAVLEGARAASAL